MEHPPDLRDRALSAVCDLVTQRPRSIAVGCLVLALASVAITVRGLGFEADRNAMISGKRTWNERFTAYRDNFKGTRDFIVVVDGSNTAQRRAFADTLAKRVASEPWVEQVVSRLPVEYFAPRASLYLSAEDNLELANRIRDNRTNIVAMLDNPSLVSVLRTVDREISQGLVNHVVSGLFETTTDTATKAPEPAEPVDLGFLISLLKGLKDAFALHPTPAFIAPWGDYFDSGSKNDGYLEVDENRRTLVLIEPQELEGRSRNVHNMRRLQSVLDEIAPAFPSVRTGITGQRAIIAGETAVTVSDMKTAGVVAALGVVIVFALGFRSWVAPLLALAGLLIGIAWSAAFATLAIGHLTVLSVTFTSILIGLGIDFGVHIVARYQEERARGAEANFAVRQALIGSGPGNIAGGITTAMAFFGLTLTGFLGLAELGIIAGAGVLLCLASAFLGIGSLLTLVRPDTRPRPKTARNETTAWPRSLRFTAPFGLALALAGFCAAPWVSFDGNLLNLQAEGLPAVDLELELLRAPGRSSWSAASVVDNITESRTLAARLKELSTVDSVDSLDRMLPKRTAISEAERTNLLAALDGLIRPAAPETTSDLRRVQRMLKKLRFKLRPESESKWEASSKPERAQLRQVRALLDNLLGTIKKTKGDQQALEENLAWYQRVVFDDLRQRLSDLKQAANPTQVTLASLPPSLLRRYAGQDGRLLVRSFPAGNAWDPRFQRMFVEQIRSVDPEVTGIPVQVMESGDLMVRGYIEGGLVALLVVLLIILFDLRSTRRTLLTLVPLFVGAGWTAGLMALLGLSFNLANLVIVPLMMGIGIDIGIHMVHRAQAQGVGGLALLRGSTGRAVVISGLTTAVGFGSLVVAQHRGIHSLGLLLMIGVLANVLAAVFVLAPLLEPISKFRTSTQVRKQQKREGRREGF